MNIVKVCKDGTPGAIHALREEGRPRGPIQRPGGGPAAQQRPSPSQANQRGAAAGQQQCERVAKLRDIEMPSVTPATAPAATHQTTWFLRTLVTQQLGTRRQLLAQGSLDTQAANLAPLSPLTYFQSTHKKQLRPQQQPQARQIALLGQEES